MAEFSEYLTDLMIEHDDAGRSYLNKIAVINVDPFTLQDEDLNFALISMPDVTIMTIEAYLVAHSVYTAEQMKAYKSLEAYKYFEKGIVETMGSKSFPNSVTVVVGEIKPPQYMNEENLIAWFLFEGGRGISCAHCTCMTATSNDVCSHIGALLFAAENFASVKEECLRQIQE